MPKDTVSPEAPKSRGVLKKGKVVLMVGVATWGGAHLYQSGREHAPNASRYPLAVEYALTRSCAEETGLWMSSAQKQKLEQRCLCAVERVERKVSYASYANNPDVFVTAFRKASDACR